MTRIILIALLGVTLSFSTSVLAKGGDHHGGHNKHGGQGGQQGYNQGHHASGHAGRHYNKHSHGHHNRHARRHHGHSAHVGYYPPAVGISLSYANHGTAIHYSSHPHGGFSIGYAHR